MTRVSERQAQLASIRKLPLSPRLNALLEASAIEAGIDQVVVYSGGQGAAGSRLPRTGSARHDRGNAGDLYLIVGKRILDFTVPAERAKVAAFVTACAARGATGIGAGTDYMGPSRLHIGFGPRAIWGAAGKRANAPKWLVAAVEAGWLRAGKAA